MRSSVPFFFVAVLLIAAPFEPAEGQTDGRLAFSFEAGMSTPLGRDLGWDSRSQGAAVEAGFAYRLTNRIALRSGFTLVRSGFDLEFYEQSVWFPFESPDRIYAQPTNLYSFQAGAAYHVVRSGKASLYVTSEAGYGAIQMPPIRHDFDSETISMLRDTHHGFVLGAGAGASMAVTNGAALRIEAGARSLLVPNSRIGDYTHTAKNRIDQLIFKIGVVQMLHR